MKRRIFNILSNHYQNNKSALLVTGARQIGKTYSIRQFGKESFDCFVEINFIDMPEAVELFNSAKNSQELLLRISLLAKTTLKPGRTLIFLDEVQECKAIVTAIKFLVDEGSYRYVLSGSLLGVELKDVRSVPVGYMDVREMSPLDFEEFLWALGVSENVVLQLKDSFERCTPVDEFVHKKIMELYRLYLIIGGMPAVVAEYLKSNNLQKVARIQESIIKMYKKDIGKYDPHNKLYLDEIFDLIPPELNAKNKRFILKNLNENVKFSRQENSFIWMKDAGVALPTFNVEVPKRPLLLAKSRNLFKLFMNVIGLLACMYADGIQMRILNGNKDINFGSIYENAVAQELHANGIPLYYFNNKKQGELDFVVELDGKVVPIEVKSGKGYERHNALGNVMENAEYGIERAYVLCNDNVKTVGNVVYLPVYMAMFIRKTEVPDMVYKVDLSGL